MITPGRNNRIGRAASPLALAGPQAIDAAPENGIRLPDRFRHNFGSELLRQTKNLKLVQNDMGHEDISSTVIYTKLQQKELREGIAQLNWGCEDGALTGRSYVPSHGPK